MNKERLCLRVERGSYIDLENMISYYQIDRFLNRLLNNNTFKSIDKENNISNKLTRNPNYLLRERRTSNE